MTGDAELSMTPDAPEGGDGRVGGDGLGDDGGGESEDGRFLANAGSLVAGRLVVAVLGWTGTIIIARTLDQETFGRFTFVFGLLGMMTIATDLGLGRVAISGVLPDATPEGGRAGFAGTYVVLRGLLGLAGYGLAVGFTVVAGYSSEIVRATAIAGLVIIIATASHGYELVLQAHLRMGAVAVSAIIGRLAQLGLIVVVVVAGGGWLWLLVPAIAAEVVIAAVKVPRSIRLQPMTYSVRPRLWWELLREAVPISLGTALATLYFRVDSIMLSKLDDFTAVAIYGVAFKFIDLLHFLSLSISAPLLTVLVRAWPTRPTVFRETVQRTVGLLALLAGGLIVHFSLFARETIELLYGASYSVGATAVQLLVVGEIIAFCSMLGLTVLTATGRHRLYPTIALAGLAANVGLNLWAIPRWSFEGAAWATIVTEVIVVVAMWMLVRRVPDVGSTGLGPVARAIPPVVLGLAVGWMMDRAGPWPIAAIGAAAVYLGVAIPSGLLQSAGVDRLIGGRT